MRFVGWVPNISGRLSFSNLSASELTVEARNLPVPPDSGAPRYVFAYHRRVTNDDHLKELVRSLLRPITKHALRIDWGLSDAFHFIAALKADEGDTALTGNVYILKNYKFSKAWISSFRDFESDLHAATAAGNSQADTCEVFLSELARLADSESPSHFISSDIRLERSGKCCVQSAVEVQSTWPPSPFWRSNHAFNFVRDLFHSHYHHAGTDDAFTALSEEASWERATDQSLYRAILQARRRRLPSYVAEAQGRLAYLKAFREPRLTSLPERHLEQMAHSFEATIAQNENSESARRLGVTLLVAVPFALTELLVHLSEAVHGSPHGDATDHAKSYLVGLYWSVSNHPFRAIALLVILGALYAHSTRLVRVERWPLHRAIRRAYATYRLRRKWRVDLARLAIALLGLVGVWLIVQG